MNGPTLPNKPIDPSVINILLEAKKHKECEQYRLSIETRSLDARYRKVEKEIADIDYAIRKINVDNLEGADTNNCSADVGPYLENKNIYQELQKCINDVMDAPYSSKRHI